MPVAPTFPGIYIEEVQSSVHTIAPAPTSISVFVGYTHPFKTARFGVPVEVFSFSDYERSFGGFFRSALYDAEAAKFGDVAQAVNQFFLNGGSDAIVIGLQPGAISGLAATAMELTIGPVTFTTLEMSEASPGKQVTVTISNVTNTGTPPGAPPTVDSTADVLITYGRAGAGPGPGTVGESYRQVSLFPKTAAGKPNPNFIGTRIGTAASPVSALVTVSVNAAATAFTATASPTAFPVTLAAGPLFGATDFTNVLAADGELDKIPVFNLLVIPGVTDGNNGSVLATAVAFCERKRAFLIMDPPLNDTADAGSKIEDTVEGNTSGEDVPKDPNAALYFPYLKSNDPLTGLAINPVTNKAYEIPPSGTVAGVFARTDANRGVWKAPAGLETVLNNVSGVVDRGRMTDPRQGVLNPKGVNCLRSFPGIGTVVFGARTSITENPAFQQWRYVPVRRMALFLEQTFLANLAWVVFEPNDEPLWTAIRTSIDAFMLGLFRQGAFQGETPSDAFQVKCDSDTTTQADIDNGIVNIVVAFAPLKPAEFVVVKIAQLAGQTQAA